MQRKCDSTFFDARSRLSCTWRAVAAAALLFLAQSTAIAQNDIPAGESEKPPAGVETERWADLKTAVARHKLLPTAEGLAGLNSFVGTSVSVSGNRALVGAPNMGASGAAIVFVDTGAGWEEEVVLLPPDNGDGSSFGASVSLQGNRALVGAWTDAGLGVTTGAAFVYDFDGSAWIQSVKLFASDAESGDQFGRSVSLDGDRLLIGAVGNDDMGVASGAAYIFDFDGSSWNEMDILTASDGEAGDRFGSAVSLSGDRALIGARLDDDNGSGAGAAYLFDLDGSVWTESTKLLASDGEASDVFGMSVSLEGDRALVGASGDDDLVDNSGAAYVFEFVAGVWVETAKLRASSAAVDDGLGRSVALSGGRALVGSGEAEAAYAFDFNGSAWSTGFRIAPAQGVVGDRFGLAVALEGNRALIGAPERDIVQGNTGSAYVFDYDGARWIERPILRPGLTGAGDRFGSSVSVEGDRALIGAVRDHTAGVDSGSAYVFDYDGSQWNLTAKLIPGDAEAGDEFGFSVSLSGDRALIGAPKEDERAIDAGAAYIFDFDGTNWTQSAKLTYEESGVSDHFGDSVALSGNRALVGAPLHDTGNPDSGEAYLFELDGSAWSWTIRWNLSVQDAMFGTAVDIEGDRIVFGAAGATIGGVATGGVYVSDFDGMNWSNEPGFGSSNRANGDKFGQAVSLSGDRILVGAPEADRLGSIDLGTTYLFEFDGLVWNEIDELLAAPFGLGDFYGYSVALDGDRAVIGAPFWNIRKRGAFLFEFDGAAWQERQTLSDGNATNSGKFGFAVGVSGDRILVGAPTNSDLAFEAGAAYVLDENLPPLARPDTITTDEDSPVNGDVLADNGFGPDSDPEGDPLQVVSINGASFSPGAFLTLPSGALLSMDAAGTFEYDPNGQFEALGDGAPLTTDTFTYSISDGFDTATAVVRIDISGVDDPPVAVDDLVLLVEDDPATPVVVLANDTDIDGGPIAVASVTQPAAGTVAIVNAGDRVTYTPDPDACNNGEPFDTFTYSLAPGGSTATVSALVECVNDRPQANDATADTFEDTAFQVVLTGSDVDGPTTLAFTIDTPPSHGTLEAVVAVDDTTAEVTYTPDPDYNGSDSFTFSVDDGTMGSESGTVSLTIEPVNDAPAFTGGGDVVEIEDAVYAQPWAINPVAGPADEAGQGVSYLASVTANPGLFAAAPVVDASGVLAFVPAADTTGNATIEVRAMDDGGTANGGIDLSPPVTFQIDVIAAADLTIDKSSGSFFTDPGGPVSYTIVVSNPGPSDVSQATVTDAPPARLGNVSWTCVADPGAACNPPGSIEIDELVNLPEGTSVTFTLDAELLDDLNDPITNTASVTTPAGLLELVPANNTDSDTDLVGLFADGMESEEP